MNNGEPIAGSPLPVKAVKQGLNMSSTDRWLASIAGGVLIGFGVQQRSLPGVIMALIGSGVTFIGIRGNSPIYEVLGANTATAGQPILVEQTITIGHSPDAIYQFWRNFENLPQFMQHLESVSVQDQQRSHWVANGPAGSMLEWDAEITQDQPNQSIAWQSLPGAQVSNTGQVNFRPAAGGRGTEVRVTMQYDPPAGVLGASVAKLFGSEPTQQVSADLRRLKQVLEAGEIATVEGQSSGSRSVVGSALLPDA